MIIIKKLFYPSKCAVCKCIIDNDINYMCQSCYRQITFIKGQRCSKCSKSIIGDTDICDDCRKTVHEYRQGHAIMKYDEYSGRIVAALKYEGRRELAPLIANDIAYRSRLIMKKWRPKIITTVPLHISKIRSRGFNQSELIAREFAKLYGVRFEGGLILRIRKTMPQKQFDDKGRKKNLQGAFCIDEDIRKGIGYAGPVLIFDDIYTTGSTIDACAVALKDAGFKDVYFLTLCIGDGS